MVPHIYKLLWYRVQTTDPYYLEINDFVPALGRFQGLSTNHMAFRDLSLVQDAGRTSLYVIGSDKKSGFGYRLNSIKKEQITVDNFIDLEGSFSEIQNITPPPP